MNSFFVVFVATLAIANGSALFGIPSTRTDIVGPSGSITQEENLPALRTPLLAAPVVEPVLSAPILRTPLVSEYPVPKSIVIHTESVPVVRSALVEPLYTPTIRSGYISPYETTLPWTGLSRYAYPNLY